MSKKKQNEPEAVTLAQWIIQKENTQKYRAGEASGKRHPKIDQAMINAIGGMPTLLEQARALKREGLIKFEELNLNTDIKEIHYSLDVVPKLCEREGIEDARARQLRLIERIEKRQSEVADVTWMQPYYADMLDSLKQGKVCAEAEKTGKMDCLNEIACLQEPMWIRTFSATKLGGSKIFENQYKEIAAGFLKKHSPFCEEEMNDDQALAQHNLLSYSQTLQWKGPLRIRIGDASEIDGAAFPYGMMLNAQTLEHCRVTSLAGIRRILLIENQANYEDQKFRDDTLYVFCHGFFSPKEVLLLQQVAALTEERTKTEHWGDMDCGGIRIFLYNKNRIFPKLTPYRMNVEEYECALAQGYGIDIEETARKRLEMTDAAELAELKEAILQRVVVIEQEVQIPSV